jgi:hypothetical protein
MKIVSVPIKECAYRLAGSTGKPTSDFGGILYVFQPHLDSILLR